MTNPSSMTQSDLARYISLSATFANQAMFEASIVRLSKTGLQANQCAARALSAASLAFYNAHLANSPNAVNNAIRAQSFAINAQFIASQIQRAEDQRTSQTLKAQATSTPAPASSHRSYSVPTPATPARAITEDVVRPETGSPRSHSAAPLPTKRVVDKPAIRPATTVVADVLPVYGPENAPENYREAEALVNKIITFVKVASGTSLLVSTLFLAMFFTEKSALVMALVGNTPLLIPAALAIATVNTFIIGCFYLNK